MPGPAADRLGIPGVVSDATYRVMKAATNPLRRLLWPVAVSGLAHVPRRGPAILAPNHISFLDSVFLALVVPRRIFFVGKAEYLDDWKTKHLFPAFGMIPVDRRGGEAAERALETAASVLSAGYLFGIFPEGTRSRDGHLHRGRTGVARLALRTGAPIVPVGIRGTDQIQPPDAPVPRAFRRCSFAFGPPIDVAARRFRSDDPYAFRQLTDEVMYEIQQLCGQPYVDVYAGHEVRTEETGLVADPEPEKERELVGAAAAPQSSSSPASQSSVSPPSGPT